jgi:hypothetical protein
LLPLPVAVLEIFMWKCPQLVCHDLLDVVHSSKMTTFEIEFEFGEKELRSGEYGGCGNTEIHFLVKNSLTERWQCERERFRDAASKCPQFLVGHDEPFF